MRNQRAFTLVELMVTVAVTAILLGLAAPSLYNVMLGSKLGSYANDLLASSSLARSEAIKRNAVVTMCVSSNGASCTSGGWEQGWLVLNAATAEVIQRQPALEPGFKISDTLNGVVSISFQPTGVGATQASLRVCRATPTVGSQERVVDINATGRASVSRTAVGACS